MTDLLYIAGSPRGAASKSAALAEAYIAKAQVADGSMSVSRIDLWAEDLPAFDGDFAAAKMTFFGDGAMDAAKQHAWDRVTEITQRFVAADHYVISVPMWNGGIPYRLKQYIDIITQPGLLFGFAPDTGYSGLLSGKKATLVVSSGVWQPGADARYGQDFHTSYLEWWLGMIGVTDIDVIRFQPSLLTADPQAGFDAARERALELA
ncbi:FMN-dependent NADH-azoreductase [Actibacterium ureilyticum]|uniref:FMN-dependent NADH-azoreductase n=1 Tax=Actibacterium ureilyticum TaxID=1590614 RepID=UPI000BAB0461|nr:NAD(P)H-dependent oxidoreductase [Actibacterium ureilyticum]